MSRKMVDDHHPRPIKEFIEDKAALQREIANLEDHDMSVLVWRKDGHLFWQWFGEDNLTTAIGILEWVKHEILGAQYEDEDDGA